MRFPASTLDNRYEVSRFHCFLLFVYMFVSSVFLAADDVCIFVENYFCSFFFCLLFLLFFSNRVPGLGLFRSVHLVCTYVRSSHIGSIKINRVRLPFMLVVS